jgi:hypothetical protein
MKTIGWNTLYVAATLSLGSACVTSGETERNLGFVVEDGSGMVTRWDVARGDAARGDLAVELFATAPDGASVARIEATAAWHPDGTPRSLAFEQITPEPGRLVLEAVATDVAGEITWLVAENTYPRSATSVALLEEAQRDLAVHAALQEPPRAAGALRHCRWGRLALQLLAPGVACVVTGGLLLVEAGTVIGTVALAGVTALTGSMCVHGVVDAIDTSCTSRLLPGDPWLGVAFEPHADEIVLVDVYPEGPACRAGVQPRDVIIALGGEPVAGRNLAAWTRALGIGATAALTVRRNGSVMEIAVPIAPAPLGI